ncbi:MAG: type II toxin-antitoxin system RelE family toxin [Patescibacteria group bacterium]
MDKIAKALQNLSAKERIFIKNILLKIKINSLSGFDLKKLKNCDNIFRIRKGKLRIIFKKQDDGQYFILAIERRSDKTYNNFK